MSVVHRTSSLRPSLWWACGLTVLWMWAGPDRVAASGEPADPDWLDEPARTVVMDLITGSCPHMLTDRNLMLYKCDDVDRYSAYAAASKPKCRWVPAEVAIVVVGQPDFDVTAIVPTSIDVAGACCLCGTVVDCATAPPAGAERNACLSMVPDGYPDFVFTVKKSCLLEGLPMVADGEEVEMILRGKLTSGARFRSTDIARVRRMEAAGPHEMLGSPIASLSEGHPNPFNPSTSFDVEFTEPTTYRMDVYDVIGRRVYSESGYAEPGTRTLVWDGRSREDRPVASGVYFLQVTAGTATAHRKVMLLK